MIERDGEAHNFMEQMSQYFPGHAPDKAPIILHIRSAILALTVTRCNRKS